MSCISEFIPRSQPVRSELTPCCSFYNAKEGSWATIISIILVWVVNKIKTLNLECGAESILTEMKEGYIEVLSSVAST